MLPLSCRASLVLQRLGAYPRQNSLALALREWGPVERALFRLEWHQNPDLRRRVQIGLNKGEAKNALARAVFFKLIALFRGAVHIDVQAAHDSLKHVALATGPLSV